MVKSNTKEMNHRRFLNLMDKITWIIIRALYSYENPILEELTAEGFRKRDEDAINKFRNSAPFHARVESITSAISQEFYKMREYYTYD